MKAPPTFVTHPKNFKGIPTLMSDRLPIPGEGFPRKAETFKGGVQTPPP